MTNDAEYLSSAYYTLFTFINNSVMIVQQTAL